MINTHCHADHITSGGKIRAQLPEVKTVISEASGAKADWHLGHGDEIVFGKQRCSGHVKGKHVLAGGCALVF